MPDRLLGLAVGRIDIGDARWVASVPWSVIAGVGPELPGLGLAAAGIPYVREERLGGLRSATPGIQAAVNGFWENRSFHRYADYALGAAFAEGLDHLADLAAPPELPVIMCSEAVWWRCHRRIIADHLIARGVPVAHLMPDGRLTPATLTSGARPQADGMVTYPGRENGPPRGG